MVHILKKKKNLTLNYPAWLGCLLLVLKTFQSRLITLQYNVWHIVGAQETTTA